MRCLLALPLLLAASASAQSLNIDFDVDGTGPSNSYSAAGRAGYWNIMGVIPTQPRTPLKGLDGDPIVGRVYNIGASSMMRHDHPQTGGGDEALVDDMLLSNNDPIDACIFFEALQNGVYDVYTYSITPDDPSRLCRVRVDNAISGPVMIGGEWPGGHAQGVTYAKHRVTVTNGTLGLHSGLFNGFFQSGINGVQLVLTNPPCGSGDFNGDGDFGTDLDIEAFFACLGGSCCATCGTADFDANGDVGTDLDIEAFFRVLGGGSC